MTDTTIYDRDLDRNPANFVPLTPISFLLRTASLWGARTAVIHGEQRVTYAQLLERCRRLASALERAGVGRGDTVAVMAPNTPAMLEAHYGVALAGPGAVLCALNTRLDAAMIAFMLRHSEARVVLVDREFAPVMGAALAALETKPLVIDIEDALAPPGPRVGAMTYEAFLAGGDPAHPLRLIADEWSAIALGYTSGTTSDPKGVVTHHRGAYLNATAMALEYGLTPESVYLWTLPMFHCNGWTYTWAVTLAGAAHACLRRVDPAAIFPMIERDGVTHMCGAPVVMTMLIHAPDEIRRTPSRRIRFMTGGAAPPSTVISRMEALGFEVRHLYGLTETYGPAAINAWQPGVAELPIEQKAAFMARQGVEHAMLEEVTVLDPETMQRVPADATTIGEIMMRGNTVMMGYLKNPTATAAAFAGGWFHSGDLAVLHPDGYVEIKDRSKDIIISGGENISSIEVEDTLYRHPGVMEAAVVAHPDEKWGEVPHAFVTLNEAAKGTVSEADIIEFCRANMARYKCPRYVTFGPLPKTSTGKIQKFALRAAAKAPASAG